MDGSHSEELDSKELEPATQASKRTKLIQKTVVTVKIEVNEGKQRSEGPPSDSWSWRKYGQKPIKGSPYPRGYYRCSTSKGCSAKKQVERCKTDASMLIITYTSSHNHPGPDHLPNTITAATDATAAAASTEQSKEPLPVTNDDHHPTTPPEKEDLTKDQDQLIVNSCQDDARGDGEDHFHYSQSPFNYSQEFIISQRENPFAENLENSYGEPSVVLLDEDPVFLSRSLPPSMAFSALEPEENDFFDELEELPSSSSFTSFLSSSNFFDERILVHPS
ncbi:hypothetical protein U1Q18_034437 [Sarracenia purpurea var. burkii]